MKSVLEKNKNIPFFVKNILDKPEIVLIFPVTRNEEKSPERWQAAIDFVQESQINYLILVDKTSGHIAGEYFLENFNSLTKNLYILPRSISESHYETLGEIQLDDNLWVMQLHDDDEWTGHLELPNKVNQDTAYYSKFVMKGGSGELTEEVGFSTPARINFTLIPSKIWNQFSLMIKDQGFHVAASLDGTLNQMVGLTCAFSPLEHFTYFYDNHNWEGRMAPKRSLNKLARHAGWEEWTSVEIALFNRLLDNLSSLAYVRKFAKQEDLKLKYLDLMGEFHPSIKRRIYATAELLSLRVLSILNLAFSSKNRHFQWGREIDSRLSRAIFFQGTRSVESLSDVVDLIRELENKKGFQTLERRFSFWSSTLSSLRLDIGV
jgi:hypothetical protein